MQMKLVKGIEFDRIKELNVYNSIKEKFGKVKKDKNSANKNSLVKNLKELKFYFVIDFEDIFDNPELFKNLFSRKPIDINNFKKENENFLEHIKENKKNKNYPNFFKKLGKYNNVNGCYVVGTTKNENVKVSTKNSSSTISIKFNPKELPQEFEDMCEEYSQHIGETLRKEQEEINKIIDITIEQQNRLMNNILKGIDFGSVNMFGSSNPIFGFERKPNNLDNINVVNSKVKLEDVIENKLHEIYDIGFLENLLSSAERDEKFELCIKIRDRINVLKSKK